jgi:beta-N-acetylhexosaminidase
VRAATIVGIAGPELTSDEATLLRHTAPAGAILFGRNVDEPRQLAALTASLRDVLPDDAVVMVDQEGGNVARLRPPHWRAHPAASTIGRLFARDAASGLRAAWLTGALIGLDARAAGFDVVTAPVLDRAIPGAHAVIGDRAFAEDPESVARLGRSMAEGLLAAGVQPVMKHLPGHGRTSVDSHLALPRCAAADLATDFAPFAANADLPWGMTAHMLYTALDSERPATLSSAVIGRVIRGEIGFQGLVVTDDLAMQALEGSPAVRAAAALAAGCDIALFCPGILEQTASVLAVCPELSAQAHARMRAAKALAAASRVLLDAEALAAERDRLLA